MLLLGSTLFWGLSFPLIRSLSLAQRPSVPHLSDQALACADTAIRFGVASLFLLPFCLRHLAGITRREWEQAGVLALLAGMGLFLQTLGLAWTDASITAFLTQLYTLLVPLMVALRDRRAPTPRVIGACGLVLAGAALLSPGLLVHFILGPGEWVIIASAFFMAAQILWVERPAFAGNRSGLVTFLMFALLSLLMGCAYPFMGGTFPPLRHLFASPAVGALMLAAILFCTVCNFYIMNAWQRFVSATEASLIYCLEPVVAALISTVLPGIISRFAGVDYPNETLTWTLLAGGLLIVSATLLVATEPSSPERKAIS